MGDISDFLEGAWADAERECLARESAAVAKRIADEVTEFKRRIVIEKNEICAGWILIGQAVAIEAALLVAALLCSVAANNLVNDPEGIGDFLLLLVAGLAAVGVIALSFLFWPGLIVVALIVIWQVANLAIRGTRMVLLEASIAKLTRTKD